MESEVQSSEEGFDVVHVTTAHPALDSRIFYREALTARKAGWRVAVVGPNKEGRATVDGVEIFPIPRPHSRFLRRLLSPVRACRIALSLGPRIVHFHDPEFIGAGIVLKVLGYKVVWDIHEYYSQIMAETAGCRICGVVKRVACSLLVEKGPSAIFDRVVFPTQALRKAIWPGRRSVACVNLLPLAEHDMDIACVDKVYDLGFLGTMSPSRAGPFLEMVALLLAGRPGIKVLLLGVSGHTKMWMLQNTPSPEVSRALVFIPRVPHQEVAATLRRCRVGFNFHPMQRRFQVALPMKVYEYMACGLPVVCSWFPELEEQLSEGEIIFVHGEKMSDYASAVEALLSDSTRMEEVGRAGNAAVRSRLNWETTEAPKLVSMYRELLGATGTRSGRCGAN